MGLTDKLIYSMFIYQKTVDRSTLRQGFQIPVEYHALLAAMPGGMLSQGETRNIKVWIDNVVYDAQLKNQGFDRNKYGDRADVIQVRYGENSPIAKKLRSEFRSTWEYATEDVLPGMPAQQIPTPLLFKQLDPQRKHHKNECCRKEYCCTFSCRLRNALQAHSKSYKMANSMETRTSSNIHFHKGMVCLGV